MQTIRLVIGTVLALALSGISILCCFVFGQHLAPGQEGLIYGVLGGVADALKAVLPIGITAALSTGQRVRAMTGMLLFLTFSAYSFASELGLYALSRDAQTGTTLAGKEGFAMVKAERERIQDRLKALGQTRPTGTIKADIAAQHQSKLWAATSECKDASANASRSFCAGVEKLTGELAGAEEAEKLRAEDGKFAAKLSVMDLATVMKSADPQSEALARFTGLSQATMRDALAILVAVLIELGSGFGLWVATASSPAVPVAPQKPETPQADTAATSDTAPAKAKAKAKQASGDGLKQFLRECIRTEEGSEIGAAELHETYSKWAAIAGIEPIGPTPFGRRLADLELVKVKRGGKVRYQGVARVQRKTAPVRMVVSNS
jgi:hypothetical protein